MKKSSTNKKQGKHNWSLKSLVLFESIFFLYVLVLSPGLIGLMSHPLLHVEMTVEPRQQFLVHGYAQNIVGVITVLDTSLKPNVVTSFDFTSSSWEAYLTQPVESSGSFWQIGHTYDFTVHSGNYTDNFTLTLKQPSKNSFNSPYVTTEHFHVSFAIWSY